MLLLLPQRYEFSSKSQRNSVASSSTSRCCCYHKGTNFQANHNYSNLHLIRINVVVATTKVRIFKQITTTVMNKIETLRLLLLPQRYEFSSKSQQSNGRMLLNISCCCYHKGTNFQANHNSSLLSAI